MNLVLWLLQGVLALAFLGAGTMKLLQPKAQLAERPSMEWARDFTQGAIRWIGIAEVAGALGLILPLWLGTLPWLTPLAALALALLMGGAVATHQRRREAFVPSLVLGVLSLFVAVGRWWPV